MGLSLILLPRRCAQSVFVGGDMFIFMLCSLFVDLLLVIIVRYCCVWWMELEAVYTFLIYGMAAPL